MSPSLQTERFWLQQIVPDDQPFIFQGLSHPQVIPFYGVRYYSLEATRAQMNYYRALEQSGSGYWWKIVEKQTYERVGAIGFNNYHAQHRKAEIGYWLLPQYWGKGIMTEVLQALIQYLFRDKKLHRVEALIEEGNAASIKVAEKSGFVLEGKMRDYEIKDGRFISLLIYSLLASDRGNGEMKEKSKV